MHDDRSRAPSAAIDAGVARRNGDGMSTSVDGVLQAARSAYERGDAAGSIALLERHLTTQPDDAGAWRELALLHMEEGDLRASERSFREALRREPQDRASQLDLGHVLFALGEVGEATALLTRVAEALPDDPRPLRNLLEMYRMAGNARAALGTAEALAERAPDDVMALLDLGELNLEVGDLEAAAAAYQRLREVDDDPDHVVYAFHGLIEVELRRERWRRALDLAIAATAADRHPLTTDLLAFVTAKLFGESDRPAPPAERLHEQLAQRRALHRRAHEEALVTAEVVQ
jgi:tetratricopeptide (TPR) repeat protein